MTVSNRYTPDLEIGDVPWIEAGTADDQQLYWNDTTKIWQVGAVVSPVAIATGMPMGLLLALTYNIP
ncbi:MAG: hypothetical protein GY832_11585 [Chloroflexi bacterium]|nr:hypothetical protein [Chloroflexota bacterium]